MTSHDWIKVAQHASQKILDLPNIVTHEYEYWIYSQAKANALLHAAAGYEIFPKKYEEAYQLEMER